MFSSPIQNYPRGHKAQIFLGQPGLYWMWKYTVPFPPSPTEPLKVPGSFTSPSEFAMTVWGWCSLGPLGSYSLGCTSSSCSPCSVSSPTLLASITSVFISKFPEGSSTLSAPRTALPQPVEAPLVWVIYCVALHSESSLHFLPQTDLFRSNGESTHWPISISTSREQSKGRADRWYHLQMWPIWLISGI